MNIKDELRASLMPPEARRKFEFLNSIQYPKLSFCGFVISQIKYIRKRVWAASILIISAAILVLCMLPLEPNMSQVWIISSLLPFFAMFTAAEISRSPVYGMQELESACKFSLPQLTGARMFILGICSFGVISSTSVLTGIFTPIGIAKAALYIISPYIATNALSLAALRRFRGQEGIYLSAASTFTVSISGIMSSMGAVKIDLRLYELFSAAVCICGTAFIALSIKKIMTGEKYYGTYN